MKSIKTEYRAYAAWDYELELEHLNQMSEQGWQLIRGGCFHTKYEQDSSVVYRYQLDHNLKIENRMRYIDTFREQGWEYVNSTFNGWHYFRKVYDPAKPAEEYEIYSDKPSRAEMAGRLKKLMLALMVMVAGLLAAGVIAFVMEPEMAYVGILIEMLAGLILTATGFVRMRAVGRGERPCRRFRIEALVAMMLLGLVWMLVFSSAKQEIQMKSGSQDAYVNASFEMRLPDWVNFSVRSGETSELNVEVMNEGGAFLISRGNAVAEGEKTEMGFEESGIFLMPGTYTVSVRCEPATSIEILID